MPTAILNEQDIINTLNYLTKNKYNINHIIDISCTNKSTDTEVELRITWKH